jgi:hypothetical protein
VNARTARTIRWLNRAAIFMAGFVAATVLFVVTGLLAPAEPVDPRLPSAATTQLDPDEAPSCAEAYEGLVLTSTDDVVACNDGVYVSAHLIATLVCRDGRTLWWNDIAWGYFDEPARLHGPRAEKVAPEPERLICHG